jgi:hypothetical protein
MANETNDVKARIPTKEERDRDRDYFITRDYIAALEHVEAERDALFRENQLLKDGGRNDYADDMPELASPKASPQGEGILAEIEGLRVQHFKANEWRHALEEIVFSDRLRLALSRDGDGALAEMEQRKDAAYFERNQVVAALAKCFPSGIARTAIEGWSDDWHGCVYIDLPTGQVSWHFHDSQAGLFEGLPPYEKPWDGHTTEEKYRRLLALLRDVRLPFDKCSECGTEAGKAQVFLPFEKICLCGECIKKISSVDGGSGKDGELARKVGELSGELKNLYADFSDSSQPRQQKIRFELSEIILTNAPAIIHAASNAERLEKAKGLLARMKLELDRHSDSYHHATDRQVLNDYDQFLSPTPRDPAPAQKTGSPLCLRCGSSMTWRTPPGSVGRYVCDRSKCKFECYESATQVTRDERQGM